MNESIASGFNDWNLVGKLVKKKCDASLPCRTLNQYGVDVFIEQNNLYYIHHS